MVLISLKVASTSFTAIPMQNPDIVGRNIEDDKDLAQYFNEVMKIRLTTQKSGLV